MNRSQVLGRPPRVQVVQSCEDTFDKPHKVSILSRRSINNNSVLPQCTDPFHFSSGNAFECHQPLPQLASNLVGEIRHLKIQTTFLGARC